VGTRPLFRLREQAADGHQYERRNNMTICRCGESKSKPFCDGTHASVNFKANTKI
jgi:CDGSH-type Zn-finger protein